MIKHNLTVSTVMQPHTQSLPTLRRSLQRIYIIVIVVSLLISGLSISVLSLFALRSYAENNLQLVASTISYTSQAAVIFHDPAAAQDLLNVISERGQFAEGRIYDAQHNLLARWQAPHPQANDLFNKAISDWLFPRPVMLPIIHNQREVGRIWLTGDSGKIVDFICQALGWLSISLFLTALFTFYLSRRMHAGILQGLHNIASVAHDVRKRRAFSLRVPPSDIAELNKLSSDFNSLLDELSEWQGHMKRENDWLAHQASHDSLTGLPNRVAFEQALARQFNSRHQRNTMSMLFIDGDRFKQINDQYGHAAGDIVLAITAQRLRRHLREEDMVARLGGDEFAVLLNNIESGEQAVQVAQHLMSAMHEPITLPQGEQIQQSLSIGIALAKNHSSPQALIAQADAAMYHIKQLGGGWYLSPACWAKVGAEY